MSLSHGFCISRKDRTGEVGVVACKVLCTWQLLGLAVKGPWVRGTELTDSCPDCINRLRVYYYHSRGSFLAGKAAWALSGRLPTKEC